MTTQARWRQIAMVAAIVGAGVSAYLLVEYLGNQGGICLTGSGCDQVRLSSYSHPLGIPLPLYGLVFYAVATWAAWRSVDPAQLFGLPPRVVLAGVALAGLAASAVLTGLEAFVIGAFCTWCLAQAGASLVLAIAALVLVRGGPDEAVTDTRARPTGRARRSRARLQDGERAILRRTAAVAAGGMTILVVGLLGGAALATGTPAASAGGSSLVPSGAPKLGSGPVTVVEFADYECPACAAISPVLAQLANEGTITLVFRDFPLPQHANAVPAARAARAAGEQGKFWEMHDRLFATQTQWENLSADAAQAFFEQLATVLGLKVDEWRSADASSAVNDPIDADQADAETLRLPGTPSIYINGIVYHGALSDEALRAAIAGG